MMRHLMLGITILLLSAYVMAQGSFDKLASPTLDLRSVVWNPQPGQGSEYDISTRKGSNIHVSLIVTGTETVNGQNAYWLELGGNFEEIGQIYSHTLLTQSSGRLQKLKWVIQFGNNPPMEMPEGGFPRERRSAKTADDTAPDPRSNGVRVGVESVTVPAGTFQCEHWRAKDGTGDVWLSNTVVPYSVVKASDKDGGSMTLTRVLSNEKSHMTGRPVPFDPSVFMALGQARNSR